VGIQIEIIQKVWPKGKKTKISIIQRSFYSSSPEETHPTFSSMMTIDPPKRPPIKISLLPKIRQQCSDDKEEQFGKKKQSRSSATKTPNKSIAWKTYSTMSLRASRFLSRTRSVPLGRGCRSPCLANIAILSVVLLRALPLRKRMGKMEGTQLTYQTNSPTHP
jgi:hypothetical protein